MEEIKKLFDKIDNLILKEGKQGAIEEIFEGIKELLDEFKCVNEEKSNEFYYMLHTREKTFFETIKNTKKAAKAEKFVEFYKKKLKPHQIYNNPPNISETPEDSPNNNSYEQLLNVNLWAPDENLAKEKEKLFLAIKVQLSSFNSFYDLLKSNIRIQIRQQYIDSIFNLLESINKININNLTQLAVVKKDISSLEILLSTQQSFLLEVICVQEIIKDNNFYQGDLERLQEEIKASTAQVLLSLKIWQDYFYFQLADLMLEAVLNKKKNMFEGIDFTKEKINKHFRLLATFFHPDNFPIKDKLTLTYHKFYKYIAELFKLINQQKEELIRRLENQTSNSNTSSQTFHTDLGHEFWILAKDYDFALKKEWSKLKKFTQVELQNYTADELTTLKNTYAHSAYNQYRAAALSMPHSHDLPEQVNLRKYMALALYFAGNLVEAQLQIIGAIYILTMRIPEPNRYAKDLKELETLYNKIRGSKIYQEQMQSNKASKNFTSPSSHQNSLKENEQLPLVIYGKESSLTPFRIQQLHQELKPELNALMQRRFAVASEQSIIKYQTPQEEILKAKKRVVAYRLGAAGTLSVAAGAGVGTVAVSAYQIIAAIGLAASGIGFIPAAALIIGGLATTVGGAYATAKLVEKAEELAIEPAMREKLNEIMQQAVEAYNKNDFENFFKVLSIQYHASADALLNFKPGKLIKIEPVSIIDNLLSHGFRPDGIAYLLNIMGEALISGKLILSDCPRSALDNLACIIFKEIDENTGLEKAVKSLDASVQYAKNSSTYSNTFWRFISTEYSSIPKEYLLDALSAPFWSRFEEIRNIARINYALTQIMIGGLDNLILSQNFIQKVKQSVYSQYQFFSISQLRLEALDDLLLCFLGANEEQVKLMLTSSSNEFKEMDIKFQLEAEVQPEFLVYLYKQLRTTIIESEKIAIYKKLGDIYYIKAKQIEHAQHHLQALRYWKKAIENYRKILEGGKADSSTFFNYVRCLIACSKFTKAHQILLKNEMFSLEPEYNYLVAVTARHLQKYDNASLAVNYALQLNPHDKDILVESKIINNLRNCTPEKYAQRYQDIKIEAFNDTQTRAQDKSSYNILSMDGGGIRGILGAVYLSELERITGYHTASMFHLMTGTSTGGIIVSGLAIPNSAHPTLPRYKASDILNLYTTQGTRIFTKFERKFYELHKINLFGLNQPQYTDVERKKLFKEYFGEKTTLSEALTELVIPAAHLDNNGSHLFTRHHARKDPTNNHYIWQVDMATSAAPTFFNPYTLNNIEFVDGGVVANNPVMAGYTEAISYGADPQQIFVWSIGTGDYVPNPTKPGAKRNLLFWANHHESVQKLVFDGPQNDLDKHMSTILGNRYHRWQAWLEEPITLDNISESAIHKLVDIARSHFEEMAADDSNKRLGVLIERLTGQTEKVTYSRLGFFSPSLRNTDPLSNSHHTTHSGKYEFTASSQSSPKNMHLVHGVLNGQQIHLERHETKGDGSCGIYALPVPNANNLYQTLIKVLQDATHPQFGACIDIIGEDIAHLALSNNLNPNHDELLTILKLGIKYNLTPNEANRSIFMNKCKTAQSCLAYIQEDLVKKNWISIGVIKSWAIITNTNLRVWQIQNKGSQKVDIRAEHIADENAPVHEILYINGNHFELLSRIVSYAQTSEKMQTSEETASLLQSK